MSLRDLVQGMSGPDVKAIQGALNAQTGLPGPRLNEDGQFGSRTDARVRDFQTLRHLRADGIVGKKTRLALFPVGVADITILGVKSPGAGFGRSLGDRYPNVMPGKLTPPSLDLPGGAGQDSPVRIPGARQPLFARILPEHILGFEFNHMELVPGGQVTLPGMNARFGKRQDAFSLTLQSIYQRGPDDGPNDTLTLGTTLTAPAAWLDGDPGEWTLAPFIQLTDVDRYFHRGQWHFWQPYAQVGAQVNLARSPQPSLTAALFPINFGYDVNDDVTIQFAAGATGTLDLSSGQFSWARQATLGVSIKFGRPKH